MNILLGLKTPGTYRAGLHGLEMLRTLNPSITIVSGCEPGDTECVRSKTNRQCSLRANVNRMEQAAGAFGMVSKSVLSSGSWVSAVLENATIAQPDLIVVSDSMCKEDEGCRPSVEEITRIIDTTKRSVLVARSVSSLLETCNAVFATDHSPFSLRCLRSLLRLMPIGLTHIRVVSALENVLS